MLAKERLINLRKALGLTKKEVAVKIGVDATTYGKYELGHRQPSLDMLQKIACQFGVSTDYLLYNSNNDKGVKSGFDELKTMGAEVYPLDGNLIKIPIYGMVKAGFGGLAYEEFEGYDILELSMIKGNVRDYFFLRVRGDSMSPEILNNDLVLIKEQSEIDYNGQIAVVVFNGDESTLKKIYKAKDYIELRPANLSYESKIITGYERQELKICGVMKKLVRNY